MVALTQGMIDALDKLDAAKPPTELAKAMHAFDYANKKRGSHIADGLNRMQDLVDGPIAEILAAKDAEIAGLRADAERWRALIGSARIRPLGCAGIVTPHDEGHAHLGLELWTHFYGGDESDAEHNRGVEWLTKYAAIAALAGEGEK